MTSMEKASLFEERLMNFAISIIGLTKRLPKKPENDIISNQIIRSATSIGANYTEANNAASKLDFRNKIYISKKEGAETRYWLKMLASVNQTTNVDKELQEITEIVLILQAIISSMRSPK